MENKNQVNDARLYLLDVGASMAFKVEGGNLASYMIAKHVVEKGLLGKSRHAIKIESITKEDEINKLEEFGGLISHHGSDYFAVAGASVVSNQIPGFCAEGQDKDNSVDADIATCFSGVGFQLDESVWTCRVSSREAALMAKQDKPVIITTESPYNYHPEVAEEGLTE